MYLIIHLLSPCIACWRMGCYHSDYGIGAECLHVLLLLLHVLCVLYQQEGEASGPQAASRSGHWCHHCCWNVSCSLSYKLILVPRLSDLFNFEKLGIGPPWERG